MVSLFAVAVVLFDSCSKNDENPNTVKDVDGNSYTIVTIGTQQWFKENLRTTKYNDGSSIPNVTDNAAWEALTTPAFAWWDNNAADYKIPYGAYYNWWAAASGKLCPTGWHVPDLDEWITLSDFLGGEFVAGGKMKETGTIYWDDPNEGATNSSGFSGIGHGQRNMEGDFSYKGMYGEYWSPNGYAGVGKNPSLGYNTERLMGLGNVGKDMKAGIAVRCVKD